MKTWTEFLLNLAQIQYYTMTNTWLHRFDGGFDGRMLQLDIMVLYIIFEFLKNNEFGLET
jgi:hypothetical protein